MLTQTDFAEKALNDYLEYNKDKIMEALDGDETLFDAKKQKALEELYNYDALDHDEGDVDLLLNRIFELDALAGDTDNDNDHELEDLDNDYDAWKKYYGPDGMASPAEVLQEQAKAYKEADDLVQGLSKNKIDSDNDLGRMLSDKRLKNKRCC